MRQFDEIKMNITTICTTQHFPHTKIILSQDLYDEAPTPKLNSEQDIVLFENKLYLSGSLSISPYLAA